MNLLEESMEMCVMLHKTTQDDVYGSEIVTYVEGSHFKAAITFDTSIQARIGMSQGVKNMYTVSTRKSKVLSPFDIFRRESDGKTFQVTSDSVDKKTPASAELDMRQCSAEEWTIPSDSINSAGEGTNP